MITSRPQGIIFMGQKELVGSSPKAYDTATAYDKSIEYSGAFDFIAIPPQAVVKTFTPTAVINQYN